MSEYTTVVRRPDPREGDSWCGEGASHDHGACGSLWDSSSERDLAEAERWEALQPLAGEPAAPTRSDVMALVYRYALARIVANASVPTRRQREVDAIVEAHRHNEREVARLERRITDALTRAGLC